MSARAQEARYDGALHPRRPQGPRRDHQPARASRHDGDAAPLGAALLSRPSLEVADIFRGHGAAWRRAHAGYVSLGQLKVMSAIESCRMAALGGHVARCEDCAHTHIAYNSCLMGRSSNGELAAAVSAFFCALPLFISP